MVTLGTGRVPVSGITRYGSRLKAGTIPFVTQR